ncbi:hypothetical protein O3M35_010670 [Rhynocoris fuscipes]|uniref:Lipase domain-containing protein n=1 Tax=Rhynocoris fuscipes TaxID=488301 RepID=A0AAW1D246_9HEMI
MKKGEDPSLSYTLINKNNVSATPGWSLIKPQNKTLPLALVIHGMGGTYNSSSNYLIGKALLDNYKDINLVSVDYSKDIETDYLTAVGKVFPVAQKVADWLTELINDGELSLEELTLIGFSLGAHVAGITGKILRSSNFTVGKIIALDPALPAFESATEDERLAKNDADYVMVLHTTGGNIAFSDPLGDIDFYPNGGTDPQPMCFTSRLSSSWCL